MAVRTAALLNPLWPSLGKRALLWVLVLSLAPAVFAHATLVFGTVTIEPSPAAADEPLTVLLELNDPTDLPVEDAVVLLEAAPQEDAVAEVGSGAGAEPAGSVVTSDQFIEVERGVYRTVLTLPENGPWTLTFRDRTYRQEEARASLAIVVGDGAQLEPALFVFPPTATGPQSLGTWLLWLIGLPIAAGGLVTVLVLRGGRNLQQDEEG